MKKKITTFCWYEWEEGHYSDIVTEYVGAEYCEGEAHVVMVTKEDGGFWCGEFLAKATEEDFTDADTIEQYIIANDDKGWSGGSFQTLEEMIESEDLGDSKLFMDLVEYIKNDDHAR